MTRAILVFNGFEWTTTRNAAFFLLGIATGSAKYAPEGGGRRRDSSTSDGLAVSGRIITHKFTRPHHRRSTRSQQNMQNQRAQQQQNLRQSQPQTPQNAPSPYSAASPPHNSSPHPPVASVLPDANAVPTEFSASQQQRAPSYPHQLDPASAAKQMAALSATARSRGLSQSSGFPNGFSNANGVQPSVSRPGTTAGAPQAPVDPSRPPTGVPASNPSNTQGSISKQQRTAHFLRTLGDLMQRMNTPLPPALTGHPTPTYDPMNSRYKIIETTAEPGVFKLAGKDVDLHDLFMIVGRLGSSAKVKEPTLSIEFLIQLKS